MVSHNIHRYFAKRQQ